MVELAYTADSKPAAFGLESSSLSKVTMPYKDKSRQKAAQRQHFEKNKVDYAARSREYKRRNREFVWKYKEENPCTDCGGFFPHYQMEFDHIGEKTRKVSSMIADRGLKAIMDEMSKCELVCALCHSARTWFRQQQGHASLH